MKRSMGHVAMAIVPVACIVVLVLLQGGFFPLQTGLLGLMATVVAGVAWIRRPQRGSRVPLATCSFFGLAASYLVSGVANGLSLTTLSEAGLWAGVAGFSLLCAAQDKACREAALTGIAWAGIGTSVLAVLEYAGLFFIDGGITGTRLEFTFQYANAAAIWFGICVLLCLLMPSGPLQSFAALPVGAMLLTQSAGGVLVFLVVTTVVGVGLAKAGEWKRLLQALGQGFVGVMLFAATFMLASPLALLPFVLVVAVCCVLKRWGDEIIKRVDARQAAIIIVSLLAISLVAAVILLTRRRGAMLHSASERLHFVTDSLIMWSRSALIGVGGNNWKYLYPYVQTAPYYSANVHSAILQVMVDAGVLGLAFLLTSCVLGVRSIILRLKSGDSWALSELAVTALLLCHSAIDFDLEFGAIAFLAALLLSGPSTERDTARVSVRGLAVGIVALVLCGSLCLLGLLCTGTSNRMRAANTSKNYEVTKQVFMSCSLAAIDPSAQDAYVTACFDTRDYRMVVNAYERMAAPLDTSTLYAAISYTYLGQGSKATSVLVDALSARPYDKGLLESALWFRETFGVDQSSQKLFGGAVGRSQQLISEFEE